MRAFNRVRYQAWAALMAAMAGLTTAITASASASLPPGGVFEVDLLFPGNATYTPQALMPVVFALQNPSLGLAFDASIGWALWEGNNRSSPGSVVGGGLELNDLNLTNNPLQVLLHRIVNTISYPDGVWTLAWTLYFYNCTPPEAEPGPQGLEYSSSTTFTVSASGQAPDLVAATSAEMCGTTNGIAINATSFQTDQVPCGVLAPNNATANPCAATINSAAASSIYAQATAAACLPSQAREQYPNVTCPTSTSKPSASSPDAAGRIAAAETLLMLLAMFTALIHLR